MAFSSMAAQAAELDLRLPSDEGLASALQSASLIATEIDEGNTTRRDLVAASQADYQRLLAVLFEAGYFGPTISIQIDGVEAAALPVIGGDAPVATVTVSVESGPRFLFGAAQIGPLPPDTVLPDGFAPGQPAGTDILRQTTAAGLEAWEARGHAKAELANQDIVADHPAARLNAILTLAPGPRVTYGDISVEGAEAVRANRIARISGLFPGQVFDPEQIRKGAQRLQRTGAFRSVSITEAEVVAPGDTLPMTIQVVERKPRRIGFGVELESEQGFSVTTFWLHRNLTGRADSFRVEGAIDGIAGMTDGLDFSVTFAYNRPATFSSNADLFVNGGVEALEQPLFSSDRVYLETGVRRILSDKLQYSYGIGYEFSDVQDDAFGSRQFSILSLPITAQYDVRDDILNPTDGFYVAANAQPFQGFLTAGPGLLLSSDARAYRGLGEENRTVLAGRLQLGSVIGPEIDEVPGKTLFFSGGGGTVRGQDFQSLGTEADDGNTVGGRSFLGASAEIRQAITESIGVVGFFDFGLIGGNSDWSKSDTHSGAGVGLRYNTGIGPIRFDVGVPVTGPEDEDGGFQIYIGIGQAF